MTQVKTQAEVKERCWPWMEQVAPCQDSCPAHVDVPGYTIAVALGKLDEAARIIRGSLPLPAVLGRVCHHPCEQACIRAGMESPVSIRAIKRSALEYESSRVAQRPALAEKKKERVAIIGSGPAGLSAARDLAVKGYPVTIFEALGSPGGMLAVGIPAFVLPRHVLGSDIASIQSLGVEIKTGVSLGKDFSLQDLSEEDYKAIFLAMGTPQSARLNIPGIDSKAVTYALPFLKDVNLGKEVELPQKVIVIGGGNVAVDCARAAVRLGSQVHLACLESREQMPAFPWETENAEKEGVNVHPSLSPQRISAKDGKMTGVSFAGVRSIDFDNEERIRPVLIQGKDQEIQADGVIIAIGQVSDPSFTNGTKGLAISRKGAIQVDPLTLATNLPGVFAGGDAAGGRASVIDTVAAGKQAAVSIEMYLRGKDMKEGRHLEVQVLKVPEDKVPQFVEKKDRVQMPTLPPAKRAASFDEVELGFSLEQVVAEAKRCLNCPSCGNCMFDRRQMCYETALRLI